MTLTTHKILIVDDDKMNLEIIKIHLRCKELTILTAESGLHAIYLVGTTLDIDLVIMDINMPEMNGLTACSEIKKIREDLPIIIDTAYAAEFDYIQISESGCDDLLIKPYTKNTLLYKIKKYLDITF